jgi:TnpA family transposase
VGQFSIGDLGSVLHWRQQCSSPRIFLTNTPPFHTKVINLGARDATYVLDGLLYHESDLRIKEHYTDTAGFTDHVFALMHLLGFRFAPRIRCSGRQTAVRADFARMA